MSSIEEPTAEMRAAWLRCLAKGAFDSAQDEFRAESTFYDGWLAALEVREDAKTKTDVADAALHYAIGRYVVSKTWRDTAETHEAVLALIAGWNARAKLTKPPREVLWEGDTILTRGGLGVAYDEIINEERFAKAIHLTISATLPKTGGA